MYSAGVCSKLAENEFLALAIPPDGCLDNCPICICEKEKEMMPPPASFRRSEGYSGDLEGGD